MTTAAAAAQLCDRFVAAWNAHDMAAFGALFHPHTTFVNRFRAPARRS